MSGGHTFTGTVTVDNTITVIGSVDGLDLANDVVTLSGKLSHFVM